MSWWFLTIFFLSLITNTPSCSAGRHKHDTKQRSAVVIGTVYCETCSQEGSSRISHFISGASVEVQCKNLKPEPSFRQEVKSDEHGVFRVQLPFRVTKHVKKITSCSVKLLNSSDWHCAVPSTAASASLGIRSREGNTHIFSSGFFSFKPKKIPEICSGGSSRVRKWDKFQTQKSLSLSFSMPLLGPPASDPTVGNPAPFPGLPRLPPLVALPPLPSLPGLPPILGKLAQQKPVKASNTDHISDTKTGHLFNKKADKTQLSDEKTVQRQLIFPPPILPPNPFQPPSIFPPNPFQPPPSIFPPNPFQPPPSIFPPNPFQPPSPPPIFPPNPFQPQPPPPAPRFPPLPPLPPLPPFPGQSPPAPPPPPPPFFSFPPLPFPPSPRAPGSPPA